MYKCDLWSKQMVLLRRKQKNHSFPEWAGTCSFSVPTKWLRCQRILAIHKIPATRGCMQQRAVGGLTRALSYRLLHKWSGSRNTKPSRLSTFNTQPSVQPPSLGPLEDEEAVSHLILPRSPSASPSEAATTTLHHCAPTRHFDPRHRASMPQNSVLM
jgi:hypothetical protein